MTLILNEQGTDVMQVIVDDIVTECLEGDNLTLQNMSSNKFVQVGSAFNLKQAVGSTIRHGLLVTWA